MKKYSIRILTWVLALVMAFSGVTLAENGTFPAATGTQSAVTTIAAAAEYLGTIVNASVEMGTDEDGCKQIAINAPFLEKALFVQIGEEAIVVRYGEEAIELSYDVLGEALGAYSFMSSGLDVETAKKLFAYVNGDDAQQDAQVWQSILNVEMNRLLSLVMERGLLRVTETRDIEINATVADVVSLLAEYMTRAAADEQLAASLSQLKLWNCVGTDAEAGAQALLAQMAAAAEEMKANPPAGVSGGLQLSILAQGSMTLNFDLKDDACAMEIHAEMVFDGEQLVASLRMSADGECFALTAIANEDGLNVEFGMAETRADAEEAVLWEGTLTAGDEGFALAVNAVDGGRLSLSLTEGDDDEDKLAFACAAGDFALDADVIAGYDVFEMEANLKVDEAKARLTLKANDDAVDGKLDMMGGDDFITINLRGRDDVFTLNGFGNVEDKTLSMNAMFIETYRGFEGSFNADAAEDGIATSIEGSVVFEDTRYAYDYRILVNGEEIARCHYEITDEGLRSENATVTGNIIERAEATVEPTETGMDIRCTTKTYIVNEDGTETEAGITYTTAVFNGLNFVCDINVQMMGAEEAMPLMQITGTAIKGEDRVAYRIDVDVQGQTMYIEGGAIREEPETEDEVRGRLYLATNANGAESRIDLPFSVTSTDTLTDISLALESIEGDVTQPIGSLFVKAQTVVLETAPAHVTGTPITVDQLLQQFTQFAQ